MHHDMTKNQHMVIMGRKRNQGKARKAAKAKAREEAEDTRKENRFEEALTAEERMIYKEALKMRTQLPCAHNHGAVPVFVGVNDICCHFATALSLSFHEPVELSLWNRFTKARDATNCDEFADVWKDSAKLETVMSYLLCDGVQEILDGSYDLAQDTATMTRLIEQYIAVEVKQTQALYNWPKIEDTYHADRHTLVKFFRHRIPCSCLDETYDEVKDFRKMSGCWNPECKLPNRMTERSKAKYCSRCRTVTYCSRKCQEARWTKHKPICDNNVAVIAEFEARQQNM